MQENSELFIGLDVSKNSHAVAVAESGREGEVRSYGEIGADAASVRRFVRKLDRPNVRLRFCYEAGPTGVNAVAAPHCRRDQPLRVDTHPKRRSAFRNVRKEFVSHGAWC